MRRTARGEAPRVFVTVGTDHHPFDRLVEWFDRWASDRRVDGARCLVQTGTSTPSRSSRSKDFLGYEDMLSALAEADIVVSHAGPGTIAECRRAGIRPVVVPRIRRFGEAVDDHQVAFARMLASQGLVDVAETPQQLAAALDRGAAAPGRTAVGATGQDQDAVARFGARVEMLVEAGSTASAHSGHHRRPGRFRTLPPIGKERRDFPVEPPAIRAGDLAHHADVTQNDLERSRTVRSLPQVLALVRRMGPLGADRMLDVGCGFGGLTLQIARVLAIREAHGLDADEVALQEARAKGVLVQHGEVGREPLGYPDEHFDLVTSFGMLDYLPVFDDAMEEFRRVLRPGGVLIVSLPNLASWNNRLALLLGYQPRDIEFSREGAFGVHPYYRRDRRPTGHIHTVTTAAFREFAEHLGFWTIGIEGLAPPNPGTPKLLRLVDDVAARRPTLAKRFLYAGRRV